MSGINTKVEKFCGRRGPFQLDGWKKALGGRRNLSWMYKKKKKQSMKEWLIFEGHP